jgi:hypothetical protein
MIALSQAEHNFQLVESIAHECRFMRFDHLRVVFISDYGPIASKIFPESAPIRVL